MHVLTRLPLWLRLSAAALALFALPFAVWTALAGSPPRRPPSPLVSGPFTVQAWFPPRQYQRLRAAPLTDAPGLVLLAATDLGLNAPVSASRVLVTVPDGAGALRIAHDLPRDARGSAEVVTADGRALLSLRRPPLAGSSAAGEQQWLALAALAGAPTPQRLTRNFSFPLSAHDEPAYALLPDGAVAALPRRPAADGGLALYLAPPDGAGTLVQTLRLQPESQPPSAGAQLNAAQAVTGAVWQDGAATLGVLARPGSLYVLDRQTQRLAARDDLAALAAAGVTGCKALRSFALAGQLLAVYDGAAERIRIVDASGQQLELRAVDPFLQQATGRPRLWPGGMAMLSAQTGQDKALAFEQQVRREGWTAPLDTVGLGATELVPVDGHHLALVDRHYCRVLLVTDQ